MSLQVSISGKRLELRERFLRSRGVRPCSHRAPCWPGTRGESGNGVGWGVVWCVSTRVCTACAFPCVCMCCMCAVHVRLCVCGLHVCLCMATCCLCVHLCVCTACVGLYVHVQFTPVHTLMPCAHMQFIPVHCTHPCLACPEGAMPVHAVHTHLSSPVTVSHCP